MRKALKVSVAGAMVAASSLVGAVSTSPAIAYAKAHTHAHHAHQYKIAFVPKLVGIPYFTAMNVGGQQAAHKFGVNWIYEGSTTADVSSQAQYVTTLINQHVDAVGVSANSPTALNPLAQTATKKGEVFYASDSNVTSPNSKLWVEQATSQALGFKCVDVVAKQMNYQGQLAIVSAGPTATNLNEWIKYMKVELKKYPKIQLLPIQYAGESIQGATQIASQILAAYPHVKGFIGVATTIPPGIAQAVKEAGLSGKVAVTGISDPNSIRPYIQDGTVKQVVLWNPVNLGYLTVWGVLQVLEHHAFHQWNNVPGLGKIEYFAAQHMLLLGPPLVIDKSNVSLNF